LPSTALPPQQFCQVAAHVTSSIPWLRGQQSSELHGTLLAQAVPTLGLPSVCSCCRLSVCGRGGGRSWARRSGTSGGLSCIWGLHISCPYLKWGRCTCQTAQMHDPGKILNVQAGLDQHGTVIALSQTSSVAMLHCCKCIWTGAHNDVVVATIWACPALQNLCSDTSMPSSMNLCVLLKPAGGTVDLEDCLLGLSTSMTLSHII
jgi:hypothetical protein